MKSVFLRCQLSGVLAVCAFFAQDAAAQGQKAQPTHYTVTDLGLANGSVPGQPFAIKNSGLIGGAAAVSDAWHATLSFLEIQVDLAKSGGLGGPNSAAFDVNDVGQAVGEAETADLDANLEDFCGFGSRQACLPFVWQNGVMSPLPRLKNGNGVAGRNAAAKAINNSGHVAGVAENTTPDSTCPAYDPTSFQYQKDQFKPVIWTHGNIEALPTSGVDSTGKAFNDPDGVVFTMNNRGQAAGATGNCTGYTAFLTYLNGLHATLWDNGSVIDLGSLGGVAPGFGNFAYGINKWGHVVGTSGTSDGSFHAFFWSPETLIQDVGTIRGDTASVGLAIDDLGDITGVSFPADPTASPRAFIRPDGGTLVDLNTMVAGDTDLYLFSACSINSRGEIIGLAFDPQGNFHGYLASPSDASGDSSDALSAEIRSARFEYAWKALRQRTSWGLHNN